MNDQEIRTKIVSKALTDAAFRAALLKDPNAAVEKALGVKVPGGVKIKVVEDSAAAVHLVLPPAPAKGELGEADLKGVAGGYDPNCIITTMPPGYCSSSKPSY